MVNQYCANCGEPVTAGERFCGNCGRDVTVPGSVSNAPPLRPGVPSTTPIHQQDSRTNVITKQSSSTPLLAGVVVVLLILAIGGYFLLKGGGNNANNNQASVVPTATPGSVFIPIPTSTPASAIVNPTDTPNNVEVTNPTDTPASAVGNATYTPDQEVSAAVATMNSLTGFHAKFTGSIIKTSLMMKGEFSKDAASYAVRDDNQVFDAIYVNNTGYISADKGKTWQNDTKHLTVDVNVVYDLLNNISIGNGDTVSDDGQTTLPDGTPAHRLGISESFGTIRITIQTVDFQGQKAVAHLDYNDNTIRIQASIDYSKFNEAVNVTAPSVTK